MTRIAIIAIALTIGFVALFGIAVNPAYADAGFVSKVENTDDKKPTRTAAAKSITKKQLKAKIKQIQDLEFRARLGRITCARANKEINEIARSLPKSVTLTLEPEEMQTGYTVDSHDTGCYIYLYPRQ